MCSGALAAHDVSYLVMEYAPGGNLRQRHPKGSQLPLDIIVSYVKQVADALQYAHQEKLVHRDIKPENMLLGRNNEVLLSDFGIAVVIQSVRSQQSQDAAGTIAYMAPEQIQAHASPASDQYALGVIVYEWLSGDRPFHGSFPEIAIKHTLAPPPPLHEKMPTVPVEVEQVVLKALAKDPQQRFPSIQAFALALEEVSNEGWKAQQEETGVIITDITFLAITNDVFEEQHHVTIWTAGRHVSGEPRLDAPLEMSALSWFSWDALPEPLFSPFENLLTGQCYPALWDFSGSEKRHLHEQ